MPEACAKEKERDRLLDETFFFRSAVYEKKKRGSLTSLLFSRILSPLLLSLPPLPRHSPRSLTFLFYLQVLAKLPSAHLRTLRHCVALLRELADNEPTTKMSEANCAMVFAPNLLRSRANDPMLFARNQENESRFIASATLDWD